MKTYSNLEKIVMKHSGVLLKDENGNFRNVVDVLEDLYIRTNTENIRNMFYEIMEEEKDENIFDNCRGREYKGV